MKMCGSNLNSSLMASPIGYVHVADSSDFGNGMTLYQQGDDGKLHPIVYDGHKLQGAEPRYPYT